MHLVDYVDEVLDHCEAWGAFEKAPHAPIAGTSTVPMLSEQLQAGRLSSDDPIAFHAMDVYSKDPLLIPVRSKNPQGVRDAPRAAWIGVSRRPKGIPTDAGGEWKKQVGTDPGSDRRFRLQFQGAEARPWVGDAGTVSHVASITV